MTECFQENTTNITEASPPETRADERSMSARKSKQIPTASSSSVSKRSEKSGHPQNSLAKEILENLSKFSHCLLLTRVGQFYESYFDQATEIARLLNIKLTTRKWDGRRVPMCGFPLVHVDKYLKVLVQQNKRFVAMCEEFPRFSDKGVKEFDRRVVRVITPGTLIDEPFLNPFENNYLLAINCANDNVDSLGDCSVGLAWIDVSTGEFFSRPSTYDNLRDELARIGPREVVLDKQLEATKSHPVLQTLMEEDNFVSFVALSEDLHAKGVSSSEVKNRISDTAQPPVPVEEARISLAISLTPQETTAINILTTYLHANLLEHMPILSSPNQEGTTDRMQIDSHTIKALEVREGIREGGTKGSLLSVIKRTITSGGTRLLARWLCSPSTSIAEINARQSVVAFFSTRPHFGADIAGALAGVEDIGRIVQRFTMGRGDPSDLLAVNRTIRTWSTVIKRFKEERTMEAAERTSLHEACWTSVDALMSRMIDLQDLSKRITMALDDEYPSSSSEDLQVVDDKLESVPSINADNALWRYGPGKWMIKPEFSPTLSMLHVTLRELFQNREQLEKDLQLRYDAPSLTLRASPAYGMHVHIGKAKRDQHKLNAASEFVTIAESASTQCYFFKEWSQLGSQIAETTMALTAGEKEAFEILRDEVNSRAAILRRNAHILDELDVALSFANLATEMNFVRPLLTEDIIYKVENGRHPTVELGLLAAGRVFTPNSVQLSSGSMLHVITGPNMAGKSTFLRQTALIAILAQVGSFVPADFATIGIVDRLFSRVGAKDDLFHDRSTFMVEMLETADILRRATRQSLVIMDEVGRGTTVKDGLAIAFATLHHLVSTNRCRTLFATHFHELSDMIGYPGNRSGQGTFSTVDFFCSSVDETNDGHFAYSYRIRPGINRDSHGLKVAQLAGMPVAAMEVAKDTLLSLKGMKDDARVSGAPTFYFLRNASRV
ncbi:hypothetical protein L208DRAFT_608417 [Tricholoma matsutake]|nr:hypothetical protein L208DRAFT_608417 [Tricholoma matsutake 945]